MNPLAILGLLAGLLSCTFGIRSGNAQIAFNPQVGINESYLEIEGVRETGYRAGYHVGLNVRVGKRFYFQPGVFRIGINSELRSRDEINSEVYRDVDLRGLYTPLAVGVYVVKGERTRFRLFGGLGLTFITDVKDNALGVNVDDFNGTVVGYTLGAGLDLAIVTIDVEYEQGLSEVFKELLLEGQPDIRNNMIRISAGIRLGQ